MRFISIDSSLANTGIAFGEIKEVNNKKEVLVTKILLHTTEKGKNKQVRASSDAIIRGRSTHKAVQAAIDKWNPMFIFAETPSGSQSSAGMKSYGMTCQLIGSLDPKPVEVTPTEVKVASVGKKTASKAEMIEWAKSLYPDLGWFYYQGKLQAKNEHMADAIAIVYAGMETDDFTRVYDVLSGHVI